MIILQIQLMYTISTFHKNGKTWTVDYTATFNALNLTMFQTWFARLMLNLPLSLLRFMTWSVLKWEFYGAFLYTSPIYTEWCKIFGAIGFMSLHIGFNICLKLGLFLWATVIPTLIFIPNLVWDNVFYYLKTERRALTVVYVSHNSSFSKIIGGIFKYILLLPYTACRTQNYHGSKIEDTNLMFIEDGKLNEHSENSYLNLILPLSSYFSTWMDS